ncbi:MAG: hypothetical protein KDE19_21820 [Caldilineaceae bacterium]|nr:hypothetical protein [Caldilineaceae bacterium]
MTKRTQIVILCEDKQQAVFARKYLEARGIHRRRITPRVCPSGKQAGEQFVREKFAEEVKTLRRKQREDRALVVIIDADVQAVTNRVEQLERCLIDAQQTRRDNNERIAIFVPKRNIETWIAFAGGEVVDEVNTFPKLSEESECVPLAQHLARNICPYALPEDAPPSLRHACIELRRIL